MMNREFLAQFHKSQKFIWSPTVIHVEITNLPENHLFEPHCVMAFDTST